MLNSSVFLFVALWTVSFQAVSVHGACCPTLELVHNGKVATACGMRMPAALAILHAGTEYLCLAHYILLITSPYSLQLMATP
jgi:hypothetical protein